MEQKDFFELETNRENMEVDLAQLDEALAPPEFIASVSPIGPIKVY
ncbi:MAG: hypothetical protein ABS939_06240 [Psychrobacillus sp.]